MTPPPPFTPEQLLEHAQSLRALARRLLMDEGAAEDVVQEAWIVALERPPAERDRIGGWLHTVVHSLVRKRRRGEHRRARRERVAAQPERQDSTLDSVMSAAQCKRLIDAVVALDEPYRTAISMRYLDDLPPREIALRLEVPKNTVRARLQRGLAMLRQGLDRDSEGGRASWAPAMLAFAELKTGHLAAPVASTTASGTLGVLAMANVGKWAIGLVALVLFGVGIVEVAGTEGEALSLNEQKPEKMTQDSRELSSTGVSSVSSERLELESTALVDTTGLEKASPPAWATVPRYPFELRGIVVDAWGRPARSERVFVAVDGQRFNAFHSTGPDGRFVFEFEASRATLDLRLYVRNFGSSTSGLRTIPMVSGQTRHLHIDLKTIEHESLSPGAPANFAGPLNNAPGLKLAPDARVRFYTQSGVDVGLPEDVIFDSSEGVFDHNEMDAGELNPTRLLGLVQAADGSPAVGTLVGAKLDGKGWGQWTKTDQNGEWRLEGLDPGEYALRAGGDEFGLATKTVTVAKGEAHDWSPFLDRGRELRGRIGAPEGSTGVFLIRAEAVDPDIEWSDTTLSDKDGRFVMPNVLPKMARLRIFDFDGNPFGIPIHVEEALFVAGGEHDISISMDERLTGSISVTLNRADGEFVPGAEVRLHHLDTGCGVFLKTNKLEGTAGIYRASGLPAGTYRLEANSPTLGWITMNSVALQAGQDLQLGQLAFERPGLLIANCAAADIKNANQWAIVQLGETVDSHAWQNWPLSPWQWAEMEAPDWVKVQLPRGDYALSVRSESTGRAWFPFRIESGGDTALDLPLALLSDVTLRIVGDTLPVGLETYHIAISDSESGTQVLKSSVEASTREFKSMLLPGNYDVHLLDGAGESFAHRSCTIEAATPQAVDIVLR